jgi:hypothetical protein
MGEHWFRDRIDLRRASRSLAGSGPSLVVVTIVCSQLRFRVFTL